MRRVFLTAIIFLALPGSSDQGRLSANTATGPDAQRGAPPSQAAAERFRPMDQNGDGVISRTEWRGSAQSFRVHDWNRDGVLSGAELREAVRQAQGADLGDFDNTGDFNDWSAARFTALDRNRDGRIARAEWPYDLDTFARADRNRDGALIRTEFLGGDFDDDRADRFDYLDVDGNNRVTRQEWHASDQAFTWLDVNRDGMLTRQEVEGAGAEQQTDLSLFGRLDTNPRNNRVSPTEWQWSRASFDRIDVNRDGVLTRQEMAGTTAEVGGRNTATVNVGGTTRWIDTGVYVHAGDAVRFQATGSVQMSGDAADVADPGGSRSNRLASDAPMASQVAGALIGRVEEGAPVFIGARTTPIVMRQTGRLFLSVNDDHLPDNRGEFRVVVNVQRRSQ